MSGCCINIIGHCGPEIRHQLVNYAGCAVMTWPLEALSRLFYTGENIHQPDDLEKERKEFFTLCVFSFTIREASLM